MKKIIAVLFTFVTVIVSAQEILLDSVNAFENNAGGTLYTAFALVYAGYTSNDVVPFWMRANKFGSIPIAGAYGSLVLTAEKKYDAGKPKNKPDWGFGVEGRINTGSELNTSLIQAYLKTKWGPFQLKAGRSKDLMGLADSTVGMGTFAMSGNALGVPKLELSFPDYWSIPFFANLFAVKGNFSIGWMGKTRIAPPRDSLGGGDHRNPGVTSVKTLLHQKSLYVRFGKNEWPLHLYGGFSHQTEFGNENAIYRNFNLTKTQSYYYAILGKTWFAKNGFSTKLGNQLGSIDMAVDYRSKNVSVFAYHQFYYDVGALAHLANLRDGLTGLRFINNSAKDNGLQWNKILIEFLYSKNQAGELTSRPTPSGDEDYYNNYLYIEGWSYKGNALGNPFFTLKSDANAGLPSLKWQNFINNRIVGGNIGAELQYNNFHVTTKLSYTRNYGTFGTSKIGLSTGSRRSVQPPPYFPELGQFSGYLGFVKIFNAKWTAIVEFGLDRGELLPNSVGTSIGIKRNLLP